jgi:hypothetical protein
MDIKQLMANVQAMRQKPEQNGSDGKSGTAS